MRWLAFAILWAQVGAGCDPAALESCAVSALSCLSWSLRCAGPAGFTVNLSTTHGGVQVSLFKGWSTDCRGPDIAAVCRYPASVPRCHETHLLDYTGPCTLALYNPSLLWDTAVEGTFEIPGAEPSPPWVESSEVFGLVDEICAFAILIFVVCAYCAGLRCLLT